jgi:LL-diaminopimelate aminotransferase
MPLKEAIAAWYKRRFGVECNLETEVLPLLGSAEGLFHIHTSLVDIGDTALVHEPCYPAYVAGVKIAGGVFEPFRLFKENGFLPDLDAIDSSVAQRAKMIWINYPNNPTAASAPPPPALFAHCSTLPFPDKNRDSELRRDRKSFTRGLTKIIFGVVV